MAPGIEQDAFLACCLKHCKEKPQIEFREVAIELGMSEGGAKNKYRDLLKKLQGDASTKPPAAKPKAKAPVAKVAPKRKASPSKKATPPSDVEVDDEASPDQDESEQETMASPPAKKKRKTGTKSKKDTTNGGAEDSNSDKGHLQVIPVKKGTKAATKGKAVAGGVDEDSDAEHVDTVIDKSISATKQPVASRGRGKSARAKSNVKVDKNEGSGEPSDASDDEGGLDSAQRPKKPATAKGKTKARKAKKGAVENGAAEPDSEPPHQQPTADATATHSRKNSRASSKAPEDDIVEPAQSRPASRTRNSRAASKDVMEEVTNASDTGEIDEQPSTTLSDIAEVDAENEA